MHLAEKILLIQPLTFGGDYPAGLATRNTFGVVSLGTSLFSFDKGFAPTAEFLGHPYVLAFSTVTIALMMKMVFNGERWSGTKKGEFVHAGVTEFSMEHPIYAHANWMNLMDLAPGLPSFYEGKDHAEANFFATSGQISPNNSDPLVMQAREAARNMSPGATLAVGMMQVTVADFLLREFPT